jgi:hypothetical protein
MAVITTNNKTIKDHMKLKRHQWGGKSLVERGKLVHNIGKKVVNETSLGRWCWMQFVGNNRKSPRIRYPWSFQIVHGSMYARCRFEH